MPSNDAEQAGGGARPQPAARRPQPSHGTPARRAVECNLRTKECNAELGAPGWAGRVQQALAAAWVEVVNKEEVAARAAQVGSAMAFNHVALSSDEVTR